MENDLKLQNLNSQSKKIYDKAMAGKTLTRIQIGKLSNMIEAANEEDNDFLMFPENIKEQLYDFKINRRRDYIKTKMNNYKQIENYEVNLNYRNEIFALVINSLK